MSMFVIAYYTPAKGAVEKHQMYQIDYDEAKAKFPDEWSLTAPAMGGKVIDRTPPDPSKEKPLESNPPPGVERTGGPMAGIPSAATAAPAAASEAKK